MQLKSVATTCLALLFAALAPAAHADLYQDSATSLEWFVDSADGFQVIRIEALNARRQPAEITSLSRIEKKTAWPVKNTALPASDAWLQKLTGAKVGDEWVVGIRGKGKSTRVFHGINLTHPTTLYRTAAMLVEDGEVRILMTKSEILREIQKRIRLDHKLPEHCDRELVDRCAVRGSRPPAASFIGGYPLPVDCWYWDTPTDHPNGPPVRLDTHINYMVVPASYPRPESMKKRKTIYRDKDAFPYLLDASSLMRAGDHPELSDTARLLVGNWKLEREQVTIHLTLHPESTMLVEVTEKPGADLEPLSFFGGTGAGLAGGVWLFDKGTLTVWLQNVKHDDHRWNGPGTARLLREKITKISPSRVTFEDGSFLQRSDAPVEAFRHFAK